MADLIERNALLNDLKESVKAAREWKEEARDEEIKIRAEQAHGTFIECALRVKNAPAVNRWIPCNERLPEQGERVIVAIFGSDMIMPNEGETLQDAIERSRKEGYITVGFIGSDGWYGADWFPLMVQPSYWMPKPDLPEPTKE